MREDRRMKRLLTTLLIAFVLVSMVNATHIEATPGTKVSVQPPSIDDPGLGVGTTFTIDVKVESVTNLYGGEFQLKYDTTFLQNTASAWGPVKTSRDPNTFTLNKTTVGNVWLVWLYLPPATAFTGDGVIATLTFKVLGRGDTVLDLHDTKLGDTNGNPITHETFDGYFKNVGPGQIPVANFTYWPIEPLINENVTFDASESSDPDGSIADYAWDFETNGTIDAHGVIVTHAYSKSQNYAVTLTVTDNDGIKSSKEITLYVVSADLIVQEVEVSSTSVLRGQNVTMTVKTYYSALGAKEPATFNVTVYHNTTTTETPIETKTGTVNPSSSSVLSFQWNTSDVSGGKYRIIAEARLVDSQTLQPRGGNETDTANNRFDDGEVTVSEQHYYDIAVLDVTATITLAVVGESTVIKINVKNNGTDPMHFNLTLYSNETQLNKWSDRSLDGGVSQTIQYNWTTKDAQPGVYNMTAAATVSGVENETSNNVAKTNVIVTKAPIANFTYSPKEPLFGVPVVFNASSSKDPDGQIIEYKWDFAGTIVTTTSPIVERVFQSSPVTVILTVKDNYNLTYIPTRAESTKVCVFSTSIILKYASFVSVSASADTVVVGSNVTISGYIFPTGGMPLMNITIYYKATASSEWAFLARTPTAYLNSTHRRYSYNWTTTLAGIYDCKAGWQGDTYRVKANSTVITVAVNKMSSTISVGVSSSSIKLGSSVVISGSIVPERHGVNVTIRYRVSGEATWQPLTTVETNETGGYSFTWTPASTGKYEIKSSWEGDVNAFADESDVSSVDVVEAGLPIFVYVVVAVVIVAVVVAAVYFVKLRKTKP